jgi:hypothetical protein
VKRVFADTHWRYLRNKKEVNHIEVQGNYYWSIMGKKMMKLARFKKECQHTPF